MASTTEVDRSSVPPASSWTTSALSPSTRHTARRRPTVVSGSYVTLSSSTRRTPPPAWCAHQAQPNGLPAPAPTTRGGWTGRTAREAARAGPVECVHDRTCPFSRRTARRRARLSPGPAHRPGGAGGGPLRGRPLPLAGRPRLGREPCLAGGAGRADGRAAGGPARAGRADRGTDGHRPGEQPHLAGRAPLLPAARTRRGACNADHVGAG